MKLYPLFFKEIYKQKVWGGNKLSQLLNKETVPEHCGESWEISGVENDISIVNNGPLSGLNLKNLIETYKEELVGSRVYQEFKTDFPLLIKFLDAQEDLSIQVHPNDQLASAKHDSFGKSEMWYVVQADNNSSLISGFKKQIKASEFKTLVLENKLDNILKSSSTNTGDLFNIPAGRVHTIGKGCLIAEIQQTSDITYRVYDFDRKDLEGNKRELHLDDAIEALDFSILEDAKTSYNKINNKVNSGIISPYFQTDIICLDDFIDRDLTGLDSFKIYMVVEGECTLNLGDDTYSLKKGKTCLIPACIEKYSFKTSTESRILEVYIPK